jgi:hypothetical protein
VLQEEITDLRYQYSEKIWLNTFRAWMRALDEIVGVHPQGVAITDMRFLTEIRGVKAMGGKILHIEAADQQANIAPELRGHRSEVELDSPEMLELRDAYLYNTKQSLGQYVEDGEKIPQSWGWL